MKTSCAMRESTRQLGMALLAYDLVFSLLAGIRPEAAAVAGAFLMYWLVGKQLPGGLLGKIPEGTPDRKSESEESRMTADRAVVAVLFLFGAQLLLFLVTAAAEWILGAVGLSLQASARAAAPKELSWSMLLYVLLLGPIAEEYVFRACLQRSLIPFGKRQALLASSFLFAVYHANLPQGMFAFVTALLFGYLAMEHSLLWSIVFHIFSNSCAVLINFLTRNGRSPGLSAVMNLILVLSLFGAVLWLIRHRRMIRDSLSEPKTVPGSLRCLFGNAGILLFLLINILAGVGGLFT